MKLRSLGIAGLLSALGLTVFGCSDEPTTGGRAVRLRVRRAAVAKVEKAGLGAVAG